MTLGSIIRLIVAVLLLPFCYAAALEYGGMISGRGSFLGMSYEFWTFAAGAAVYLVIFIFFHKTIATWVLGRASVQKAWGTITGFRRLDAESDEAGSATLTDAKGRVVPLWAVLAPYLVPLYTVAGVLVVWIVMKTRITGMSTSTYLKIQAFLIGLTYTFHLFMLFQDVRRKHTDIRAAGYVFTLVIVFLVNLEILALLGWLVFEGGDWLEFNRHVLAGSQNPYRMAVDWISSLLR